LTSFDTFFSDRIEVVKGPSSTTFGRGDPAGFINYVSKRPQFRDGTDVGILFGTGNGEQRTYRATIDHDGFLSMDHQTAYRFSGLYTEGAQSMEFSRYRRSGAQLAVARNLKDGKGKLDVVATYMDSATSGILTTNNSSSQPYYDFYKYYFFETSGIVVPTFPMFSGNFSLPLDRAGIVQHNLRLTAILDYKLSEHWRTRQAVMFRDTNTEGAEAEMQGYRFFRSPEGTLMSNAYVSPIRQKETRRAWQSDFLGAYEFDHIRTKVSYLGGFDINDSTFENTFLSTTTARIPQPVYAWNPHVILGPYTKDPYELAAVSTGPDWSYYGQGQIKFLGDKVWVTAATRKIYQDIETLNRSTGAVTRSKRLSPLLPAYSILYRPLNWLSVYATKSKHIQPASVIGKYSFINATLEDVSADDPRRTETLIAQPQTELNEVGVKASLFRGRLTMSVAHYKVQNTGSTSLVSVAAKRPDGSTYNFNQIFLTNAASSAWEVEAFGQINSRLTFMLGATLGSSSNQLGPWKNTIITVPITGVGDSVYGYGTYSFGKNRYNGFNISAGWKTYFSGWYLAFAPTPEKGLYPNDEHFVDLGLSYGFKNKYEVFVSGNNIFHKDALPSGIQSAISGRQISFGINGRF